MTAEPGNYVDPIEWNIKSDRDDRFPTPVRVLDVDDHGSVESGKVYLMRDVSGHLMWRCSIWFSEWDGGE
jgi:hypothetical protein